MNKSWKDIDAELGIESNTIIPVDSFNNKMQKHEVVTRGEEEDIENDYTYQRDTLYSLVEKGQKAVDGILELAKEGEHPRGYEVALNGIKQVAEVTEKLGDLQDKMKKLKDGPNAAPKTVNNSLFVGSTAELQKMLKGK